MIFYCITIKLLARSWGKKRKSFHMLLRFESPKLAKAQLLSPPSGDLHSGSVAIFNSDMTLMKGRSVAWTWNEENDMSKLLLPYAYTGDLLVTMQHGNAPQTDCHINGECNSTSLSEPSFCIHHMDNTTTPKSWKGSSNVLKPIVCTPFRPGGYNVRFISHIC